MLIICSININLFQLKKKKNSGWHCYVASATKQILKDRDRLLHRFEMTLNCQTLQQDSINERHTCRVDTV